MTHMTSTALIIDALGGNQKVAALTGASPGSVSGWRNGKFPAATYVVMHKKLSRMGFSAPDSLWSMRPKPKVKRKQRRANGK